MSSNIAPLQTGQQADAAVGHAFSLKPEIRFSTSDKDRLQQI